jgi:hypothetical protein
MRKAGRHKRLKVGFWKIRKTPSIPSEQMLAQLKLKPLDYKRYARTKNGGGK